MTPTILIVDDEVDLREAIAFDFRRKKFNVLLASGGHEAFKMMESQHIDVVLSDVRMPNGDGIELLDRIKASDAFRPVVMLITGFTDLSLEMAYDKGVDAVFSKPFDRKLLFAAVEKILQAPLPRLQRKLSRVDATVPVGARFPVSNFSVDSLSSNIGRGGLCMTLQSQLPEMGETVEFNFTLPGAPQIRVTGEGIVRWVRTQPEGNLPKACGIEFTALDETCVREVVDFINFQKTRAYIPRL